MAINIGHVYRLQGDCYSKEWVGEGVAEQRDKLYELLLREIDNDPDNENLLISIKQNIDYLNDIAPFRKY